MCLCLQPVLDWFAPLILAAETQKPIPQQLQAGGRLRQEWTDLLNISGFAEVLK